MKRILPALLLASAVLASPAHAATTTCKSADLRYPFQKGGPKTFGVFHLRATRTSCSGAHAVAAAWKKKFEVKYKLPKAVNGYTFTELPAKAAQTYRLRGVKGSVRINFDYVVPNG
jgi:hypothetical protein